MHFVTRKISAAARIAQGSVETLVLGNLEAKRDWGFAPEYMCGAWQMLQQAEAADYVLATGRAHSVESFVDAAFACIGMPLRWEGTGVNRRALDGTGRVRIAVSRVPPAPAVTDGCASRTGRRTGLAELKPRSS